MKRLLTLLLGLSLPVAAADHKDADCAVPPKNVIEGRYLGEVEDYARDIRCAKRLVERSAPKGFITIFGSARLGEKHEQYKRMKQLAEAWTRKHPEIPIMTGGGPGLMEAANLGAKQAGGKSLGFSTRFGQHGVEKPNPYMTDHLELSDFATRESWMINPARGIVVGSGGVGTAWELFESISKKQTGKIDSVPIIFLGSLKEWKAIQKVLDVMVEAGTVKSADKGLVVFAETVDQALAILEKSVK